MTNFSALTWANKHIKFKYQNQLAEQLSSSDGGRMEGKRDHHSGEKGVGSLGEAGEKRGRVLYMVGPKRKEVNFSVELNCVQLGALFSKDLVITGPGKLVYVWYVYIQDPQLNSQ